MRIFLAINLLLCLWKAAEAIQCFSCMSNERHGRFCRKISEGKLVDCPDESTWCNALVFIRNGKVHVQRGCSGDVDRWGFGQTECDIMEDQSLLNVGVALYQCRGDSCNNIEPADENTDSDHSVVLSTKAATDEDSFESRSVDSSSFSRNSWSDSDQRLSENAPRSQVFLGGSYSGYPDFGQIPTGGGYGYYAPPPPPPPPPRRVTYARPTTTTTEYEDELETTKKETKYQPTTTTTTEYEDELESTEQETEYRPPTTTATTPTTTTTTTTTRKRKILDYGGEEVESATPAKVMVRPTQRRRRTLFDRK